MIRGDWFGGSPWAVLIRLVLICFVVGIVMNTLQLDAWRLVGDVFDATLRIIRGLQLSWLEPSLRFILLGATVVLPIWLIARLIHMLRGPRDKAQ